MALADADREPADGIVEHAASHRRYEVKRKDGKLWHRELLQAPGSEEVLLSEYPVKYVVGSGRHSLTYLVEAEGFLVESPITWYRSQNAWRMSPDYEMADQPGFGRAIGEGCLVCHTGHVEAEDRSLHRMKIHEAAIGCEKCHGPGSLHVDHRKLAVADPGAAEAAIDHTIVNPGHLSRRLAEAVCQQCHLRGVAAVQNRGKKVTDFRPGLPLEDFRQDYVFDLPESSMTVVGHVEQLHQSRCYQGSETLTCVTCHDPHRSKAEQGPEDYRAMCLKCHQVEQCNVTAAVRQKESPENNCIQCHMPSAPTELLHIAFTHHRIGIHPGGKGKEKPPSARNAKLRPFLEASRFGEIDRKRSLGLAYQEVANGEQDPAARLRFGQMALDLQASVWNAGLRDPLLDASLARLSFEMKLEGFAVQARSALTHKEIDGPERCNAMFQVAFDHVSQRHPEKAKAVLKELTQLRRQSLDWLLLADCERALGNQEALYSALETAVRINPRLAHVHKELADHYRQQGNTQKALWHQLRAVP